MKPVFAIMALLLISIFAASVSAQTCLTIADADCSGDVNLTELVDYIGLWYRCSSCYPELFQAIEAYYGIYTSPQPDFPTDYVSWWKFDGDATDVNGLNDGSFHGNATTVYDSGRDYSGETIGYVLSLDGSGDYVNVDDDSSLRFGTGDFSISAWIKTEAVITTASVGIATKGGLGTTPGVRFSLQSGNFYILINNGSAYNLINPHLVFDDGEWHHAVVVLDRGSNLSLYFDGYPAGVRASNLQGSLDVSQSLRIGRSNYGYFNGSIDDLMIFNRTLAANEIFEIYHAQKDVCTGVEKCSDHIDPGVCASNPCGINLGCEWNGTECYTAGDTWYVQPFGGNYSQKDGSSYDNAWDGLENVVWGKDGVDSGDTLYVCGLHLRTRTGGSAWEPITPGANGLSESSRITIRGDCPNGQGIDQGIIWGAGIMAHDAWVNEGSGVWSITEVSTPNSQWYFENITADSWSVLKKVNNLTECQSTPGTYYSDSNFNPNATAGTVKLYVHPTGGGDPTGRIAANRLGYHLYVRDNHYITWKNLKFYAIYRWIDYGGSGAFVTNMRWENSTIWYGEFIHFLFRNGNRNIEFIDSDIGWASNGIGFAEYPYNSGNAPDNITIRGNTIHDIGVIYGTSDSHGIAAQGSNNVLIENNELYNVGSGFTAYVEQNQLITNYTVRWNWVHDTHGNFGANSRGIEFSSGATADNTTGNRIYGNIVGPNVSGVGYRYNWEETGEFFNNVCYDCGQSFYFGHHLRRVRVKLRNIISLNPRNTHIEYRSHENPGDYIIDSDYNLFWPISGDQFFFWEYATASGGFKTFAEWQALSKNGSVFDPHSIVADPNFVSSDPQVPADFKLLLGSPAIDAGFDVGLTLDYEGNAIPRDGDNNGTAEPDIGAYEHQG